MKSKMITLIGSVALALTVSIGTTNASNDLLYGGCFDLGDRVAISAIRTQCDIAAEDMGYKAGSVKFTCLTIRGEVCGLCITPGFDNFTCHGHGLQP